MISSPFTTPTCDTQVVILLHLVQQEGSCKTDSRRDRFEACASKLPHWTDWQLRARRSRYQLGIRSEIRTEVYDYPDYNTSVIYSDSQSDSCMQTLAKASRVLHRWSVAQGDKSRKSSGQPINLRFKHQPAQLRISMFKLLSTGLPAQAAGTVPLLSGSRTALASCVLSHRQYASQPAPSSSESVGFACTSLTKAANS